MRNDNNYKPFLIIISGPTASGKTFLSEQLGKVLPIEIINADMGQFYQPFAIGTAKPDWKNSEIKHHLFDILTYPKDLSVMEYRNLVLEKIREVFKKKRIPVIVGGSLFYLKSLFFSMEENITKEQFLNEKIDYSWEYLDKIDKKRASDIHPNDGYRIKRAIDLWLSTGIQPSKLKPIFDPVFDSIFIYLDLDKNFLDEKIAERTMEMLKNGWINEVESFIDTCWQDFLEKKSLIGYKDILNWIKNGSDLRDIDKLTKDIITKTRQYAKRQKTFWKSFKSDLQKSSFTTEKHFIIIQEYQDVNIDKIKSLILDFQKI